MRRRSNTVLLTLTALFTALIILQSFVPNVGYIKIIPILPSITTIVITVSIAGALMGPKFGALIGLIWGLLSLFMAYTQPGDPISLLLFRNPVISVVPRVMVGFLSGLVSTGLANRFAFDKKAGGMFTYGLSGLVGALTNTGLVILFTALFFMGNSAQITNNLGTINQNSPFIVILMGAFGINGITEAVVAAIVTPLIVIPLKRALRRQLG